MLAPMTQAAPELAPPAETTPAASEVPDPELTGVLPQSQGCQNCGALLDADDKFCGYCGGSNEVATTPVGDVATRHFRCGNCGSSMSADPNQRSYVCPFCDAATVVEFSPDMTGRQPPEFVIGFAVTPDVARTRFHEWIAEGGFFRPGDLKSAKIEDKLRGVYIPFWSFSMLAESQWGAQIGEYWYRTETYTTRDSQGRTVTRTRRVRETEWWPLSGRHHRFYSHYLVSGSRGISQAEADAVKPFHLAALHRYSPRFLAGWLCEEYTVERDAALQTSMQVFQREEQHNIARFLPGDTHSALRVQTSFSRISSDLVLLPTYLANYRHRGKTYRFLINGQTGTIAGQKPLSALRITIAVLLALAFIGALVALAMYL
jgi:hypothetical protein